MHRTCADPAAGSLWSPTPAPVPQPVTHETSYGFGFAWFRHNSQGLDRDLQVFVAREYPIAIARLRLRNQPSATHTLCVYTYRRIILGILAQESSPCVDTDRYFQCSRRRPKLSDSRKARTRDLSEPRSSPKSSAGGVILARKAFICIGQAILPTICLIIARFECLSFPDPCQRNTCHETQAPKQPTVTKLLATPCCDSL